MRTASGMDNPPPNAAPANPSSVPAATTPRIVGVSASVGIFSRLPTRCNAIFSATFSCAP